MKGIRHEKLYTTEKTIREGGTRSSGREGLKMKLRRNRCGYKPCNDRIKLRKKSVAGVMQAGLGRPGGCGARRRGRTLG